MIYFLFKLIYQFHNFLITIIFNLYEHECVLIFYSGCFYECQSIHIFSAYEKFQGFHNESKWFMISLYIKIGFKMLHGSFNFMIVLSAEFIFFFIFKIVQN